VGASLGLTFRPVVGTSFGAVVVPNTHQDSE
jgi:hypothetical protein